MNYKYNLKLPLLEVLFYFIFFAISIIYGINFVFLVAQDFRIQEGSENKDCWNIFVCFKRDTSDKEWFYWLTSMTTIYYKWLLVHVFVNFVLRYLSIYIGIKVKKLILLSLSVCFSLQIIGFNVTVFILLEVFLICFCAILFKSTVFVWCLSLLCLSILNFNHTRNILKKLGIIDMYDHGYTNALKDYSLSFVILKFISCALYLVQTKRSVNRPSNIQHYNKNKRKLNDKYDYGNYNKPKSVDLYNDNIKYIINGDNNSKNNKNNNFETSKFIQIKKNNIYDNNNDNNNNTDYLRENIYYKNSMNINEINSCVDNKRNKNKLNTYIEANDLYNLKDYSKNYLNEDINFVRPSVETSSYRKYLRHFNSNQKKYNMCCIVIDITLYIFYLPLFIFGPLVLFQDFQMQINKYLKPVSKNEIKACLKCIIKSIFWSFIVHLTTYTLHSDWLIKKTSLIRIIPIWSIFGLMYAIGQLFMVKYFAMWSLAKGVTHLDGIITPGLPACITTITSYGQIWKSFDRGLYDFIKIYIFIPLGGSNNGFKRNILSMMLCFGFIAIWHGMDYSIFSWVGINYLAICVEILINKLFNNQTFQNFEERFLSKENICRYQCIAILPILIVSHISIIIFLAGPDSAYAIVHRIINEYNSIDFILIMFALYCMIQIGKQYELFKINSLKKD